MSDKYTPKDLQDNLDYLNDTKALIKQAIIDKEQPISDNDTFRSYADKIRAIETGIKTDDATAVASDILAPKTAYVNGEKITGNIVGTYDSTLPEQISKQIYYGTTLDDICLEYNIAIRCESSSLLKVYRVNDTNISSTYSSISNIGSTTYYAGTGRLAQKKCTYDGVDYLRAYALIKNSNNVVGIASVLINIETLEITNSQVRTVSSASWNSAGTTTHTPMIQVIPNTEGNCMISYFKITSADKWVHFQVMKFTKTGSSASSVTYLGINDSGTASGGVQSLTTQFSSDGTVLVYCAVLGAYFGNVYGSLVATSSDGFMTFSEKIKKSEHSRSPSYLYKLIDNTKVSKANSIYNINNLNSAIGTLPYTSDWKNEGIQLGKYLYFMENKSSTTIKVYKIGDTSLTLTDTIAVAANINFMHYAKDFIYSNTNNYLVGYKLGELGTLIGMNRLGVDFYNLYEANETTSDDILKGKIVYTKSGKTTGTMPNNGTKYYTPGDSQITIPKGYHSGSGYIRAVDITSLADYKACDLLADEILSGTLPYYELEYIQSSGTQYINTGVTPSNHYVELKSKYTTATDNSVLFGVGSTDFHMTWYASKWYYGNKSSEKSGGASYLCTNENTIIYGKDNKLMINGNTVDSSVNPSATSTLHILNRPNNSTTKASARIYYFKIYNKSTGALVRDFIPVKRKIDNVVCLYDKVSKTYYTNAGTGSFIAGPVIEEG